MRISNASAVVLCGLVTLAATVEAQPRHTGARASGQRVATRVHGGVRPTRVVYVRGYGYRPYALGYYGFYSPFYDPFLHGPYPYPYYGTGYDQSALRLEVKPVETEVYVDGYYAGVVDSYDGFFQRLRLPAGAHEIELYLPGHETAREAVFLDAGDTYRIRHTMVPLAAGAPQPPRPEPAAAPLPGGGPAPGATPPAGVEVTGRPSPEALPLLTTPAIGTLGVRVQPANAEVRIDGERWEGADALGRLAVDLMAGRHAVEVRRDGYLTYRTEVDVVEGEVTRLNISLPVRE